MHFHQLRALATYGILSAVLFNPLSSRADVFADAVSLGLTPESLTAAGCEMTDVQQILSALEQSGPELAAIQQAAASCQTLTIELRELRECLALSPRDETAQQQVTQKAGQAATALTSLQSLRADLVHDLISPYGQAVLNRITAICSAPDNKLPVALHVTPRTEEEWVCLDAAYRAEKRALRRGNAVPAWASTALAAARSDPQVQLVEYWMDTRFDEIAELFERTE